MDNRDTEGKQGDFGGISGRNRGRQGDFGGIRGISYARGRFVCFLWLFV